MAKAKNSNGKGKEKGKGKGLTSASTRQFNQIKTFDEIKNLIRRQQRNDTFSFQSSEIPSESIVFAIG